MAVRRSLATSPLSSHVAHADIFFIWLSPEAPLASAREVQHPLPPRYEANIDSWGAAYGCHPRVLDGIACLEAVQSVAAALKLPALVRTYLDLAAAGRWVELVDIARVAVIWLGGHGGGVPTPQRPLLYVDTDTLAGEDALDLRASSEPLLVLPQDAEGHVQNCFIAVNCTRHPFCELLLRAVAAGSEAELHPVRATGPALLTALLIAVGPARLPGGGGVARAALPLVSGPLAVAATAVSAARQAASDAAAARGSGARSITGGATLLQTLISPPPAPAPAPTAVFPFLASIPRLTAAVELAVSFGDSGGARTLRDSVHLLPPSALFPRHWRVPDDGDGSKQLPPPANEPHIGRAAPHPLFPRLRIPKDLADFLRAPPPPSPAASAAAEEGGDCDKETAAAQGGDDAGEANEATAASTAVSHEDGLEPPPAGSAASMRLGAHTWDCTWGGGRSGEGYSGSGYGYEYGESKGRGRASSAHLSAGEDPLRPAARAALIAALRPWLSRTLAAWRAAQPARAARSLGHAAANHSWLCLWDDARPPLASVPSQHLARRLQALEAGRAHLHADDAFGTASLAVRVVRNLAAQGVLRSPSSVAATRLAVHAGVTTAAAPTHSVQLATVNPRHPNPAVML